MNKVICDIIDIRNYRERGYINNGDHLKYVGKSPLNSGYIYFSGQIKKIVFAEVNGAFLKERFDLALELKGKERVNLVWNKEETIKNVKAERQGFCCNL